jgi:hypothetical protein
VDICERDAQQLSLLNRYSKPAEGRGCLRSWQQLAVSLMNLPVARNGQVLIGDAVALLLDHLLVAHTRQSQQAIREQIARFARFVVVACDTVCLDDITVADIESFCSAVKRGQPPSLATRHARLSAVRLMFAVARHLSLIDRDPSLLVRLPARTAGECRPLTDTEMDLARYGSLHTLVATRIPALVALAEATAVTGEMATITARHIDLDAGIVMLPGCRTAVARAGLFSDWGRTQIARRIRTIDDPDRPLIYDGGGRPEAAQASVSVGLRRAFDSAGLINTDIGLGSIRARTGANVFAETGSIESAARVLGCRSLDIAARLIGHDWQQS